jgi:hypothetical protein
MTDDSAAEDSATKDAPAKVTVEHLVRFSMTFSDLADEEVMHQAWGHSPSAIPEKHASLLRRLGAEPRRPRVP